MRATWNGYQQCGVRRAATQNPTLSVSGIESGIESETHCGLVHGMGRKIGCAVLTQTVVVTALRQVTQCSLGTVWLWPAVGQAVHLAAVHLPPPLPVQALGC